MNEFIPRRAAAADDAPTPSISPATKLILGSGVASLLALGVFGAYLFQTEDRAEADFSFRLPADSAVTETWEEPTVSVYPEDDLEIEALIGATNEAARSEAGGEVSPAEPTELLATTPAEGRLRVVHLGNNFFELSGTMIPPSPCFGDELIEFELNLGNGEMENFTLADCQVQTFSRTAPISPTVAPVSPELVLRQIDTSVNAWTNLVQSRYSIRWQGSTPTITKLY